MNVGDSAGCHIYLDITRILRRAIWGAMSGIDRVELSYAEHLPHLVPGQISFTAYNPLRGITLLPDKACRTFVSSLADVWRGKPMSSCRRSALSVYMSSMAAPTPSRRDNEGGSCYLLVSHNHLDRPAVIEKFLRRTGAAFVPVIHDLIPITFPEYVRPGGAEKHLRRVRTVDMLADAAITVSGGTARALQSRLERDIPVLPIQLGAAETFRYVGPAGSGAEKPYFVCVGTIEPRKNHLLLLQIWRKMAEAMGPGCPGLVLIGRRGWENEMVVDMLDRSPALRGNVRELDRVPDMEMASLVRGARALLLPSFAEGFGLPVAEALSQGVPVICSDLPELREAGQGIPEYLDALDAKAWEDLIRAYSVNGSPERAAQIGRLSGWKTPSWEDHVARATAFAITTAVSKATYKAAPGGALLPLIEVREGSRSKGFGAAVAADGMC